MASWLFNVRLIAAVCLLSVIFLPGCGDIAGTLGGIIVSPSKITIGINQSQFFTALGRSSGGFLIATVPVWSVQGSIGSINSISGLFQAGTVEVTGSVVAMDGTLTGSSVVTITKHGWLAGNVTDSNNNLMVGIRVYLAEIPTLGDEADSLGNYKIADIPAGTYEAVIDQHNITQGATFEVTIGEGLTTTHNFILSTPSTSTTSTTGVL